MTAEEGEGVGHISIDLRRFIAATIDSIDKVNKETIDVAGTVGDEKKEKKKEEKDLSGRRRTDSILIMRER